MCGFQMVAAKFFPLQIRYFQSEFKLFSYWKKKKLLGIHPSYLERDFLIRFCPTEGDQLWAGLGLVFFLVKTVDYPSVVSNHMRERAHTRNNQGCLKSVDIQWDL